jgi:uncharacterized cupredoxin-like copper-binding protein
MPRPVLPRAALAACAVLALAGCGEDKPVTAQNRTVGVKLDEYRIVPEVVRAPAGALRVIARNRGRLTHNLKIQRIPNDPEERFEDLGGTDTLQPGERGEARIVLRPGRYRMACSIANHDELGQYGTLIVE